MARIVSVMTPLAMPVILSKVPCAVGFSTQMVSTVAAARRAKCSADGANGIIALATGRAGWRARTSMSAVPCGGQRQGQPQPQSYRGPGDSVKQTGGPRSAYLLRDW